MRLLDSVSRWEAYRLTILQAGLLEPKYRPGMEASREKETN